MNPAQPTADSHADDALNDIRRVLGKLSTEDLSVLVLATDELYDFTMPYAEAYDLLMNRDDLDQI